MIKEKQLRRLIFANKTDMDAASFEANEIAYALDTGAFYISNGVTLERYTNDSDAIIGQIDLVASEPVIRSSGHRYINTATGNTSITAQAVTANNLVEWNGTVWVETVPSLGMVVYNGNTNVLNHYNGGAWDVFATAEILATPIDSSGGVVAETLVAATGSGTLAFYVNEDVQSNTASITVQAGESLNGEVDGTFFFSNFADGTQFQAVDAGVGEWYISPTGAAASLDNWQTQTETLPYAVTAVEGVSYTHDGTEGVSGGSVSFGNVYITRNYLGNGLARIELEGETPYWGNDATITMQLPTDYLTSGTWGIVDRDELNVSAEIVITFPSADQIGFNRDDNISGSSPFRWKASGIGKWVGDTPDGSYVLAGMAQVEDISRVVYGLANTGSSATILPWDTVLYEQNNPVSNAAGTLTFTKAGTYRIEPYVGIATSSNDLTLKINGAVVRTFTEGSLTQAVRPYYHDASVNDTITIEHDGTVVDSWYGTTGSDFTTDTNFCRIIIEQVATRTDVITETSVVTVAGGLTAGHRLESDGAGNFNSYDPNVVSFLALNHSFAGTSFITTGFGTAIPIGSISSSAGVLSSDGSGSIQTSETGYFHVSLNIHLSALAVAQEALIMLINETDSNITDSALVAELSTNADTNFRSTDAIVQLEAGKVYRWYIQVNTSAETLSTVGGTGVNIKVHRVRN